MYTCPNCHDRITVHADGTLACSCEMVDADEPIPAVWDEIADELRALRAAELNA